MTKPLHIKLNKKPSKKKFLVEKVWGENVGRRITSGDKQRGRKSLKNRQNERGDIKFPRERTKQEGKKKGG